MKKLTPQSLPTLYMHGGLLLLFLFAGCSKEPQKDGVYLSEWIDQLGSSETTYRIEAAEAIGEIGSPARAKSETVLRNLARNDPMPKVRVAAILALKAVGAPANEFDNYLAEVTAPLNEPDEGDLSGLDVRDELGEIDERALFKGLQDDDLEYLKELEGRIADTIVTSEDVMPSDPEKQKEWAESRRKEHVDALLQQFRNPEVLAELLGSGELLEKRFAARLLGEKEGVSERVFAALSQAANEPDTLLKKLAADALKKWQKE